MTQKTKGAKRRRPTADERIDESVIGSFPASDPPPYSGAVAGGPRRDSDDQRAKRKKKPKR